MIRLQVRVWWLDASYHARSIGPSKSNVGRKSKCRPKNAEKTSSQKWVCLVGKMFPHPVASFCTHLDPPSCHIPIFFFFKKSGILARCGAAPIGADYPSQNTKPSGKSSEGIRGMISGNSCHTFIHEKVVIHSWAPWGLMEPMGTMGMGLCRALQALYASF